jgi:acetoacetyl-CoA synthetase
MSSEKVFSIAQMKWEFFYRGYAWNLFFHVGCFAQGSSTFLVYAGELQKPALGMKAKCYDKKGNPVLDQTGELVCEAPSPSMPLCFWNDPNNKKYLETYFNTYPNVWCHGDYIMIHTDTKGITFFGRSDAVLKPSGVRIGTAQIYNEVEKLVEICDSLAIGAIGQEWKGDQCVILFAKLSTGYALAEEVESKIRKTIRENASPRHVPSKIIEVPDISYTLNMKKVEVAINKIIRGKPVFNKDALINPRSLDYYEGILSELQQE